MATRSQAARKRKQRARDKYLPGLCNVVGVFLILLVFVIFLPITAPQLAGYEVFNVVSGSMQPYMPADSAIYVKPLEPEDVKIDDLAAFNGDDSVVVHRVVDIRPDTSEFVIKNDTSDANESDTISYDALIGRVEMHLPLLGKALAMYTSGVGKVYLVLTFACGVMLNVLADRLRDQRRIHQLQAAREALGAHGEGSARANELIEALAAPRRFSTVRAILVGALASVFICSAAVVIFVNFQHAQSDKIYDEAESLYVYDQTEGAEVPITIDFDALTAKNPDIVGWIYCAGTPINYPVLKGQNNDQYLHNDYTGAYSFDGCIFVESENKPDFSDYNTVIYGHYLYTGKMFSCLSNWSEQDFYEDHPVMWLLTPTQDYRIDLVSGHHTDAYSDMYTVFHEPGEDLTNYLEKALEESYFTTSVQVNPNAHYVMLSTCAYIFENARFVIHGMLVPLDSVGGVPR